jgi:hypothetical protein
MDHILNLSCSLQPVCGYSILTSIFLLLLLSVVVTMYCVSLLCAVKGLNEGAPDLYVNLYLDTQ